MRVSQSGYQKRRRARIKAGLPASKPRTTVVTREYTFYSDPQHPDHDPAPITCTMIDFLRPVLVSWKTQVQILALLRSYMLPEDVPTKDALHHALNTHGDVRVWTHGVHMSKQGRRRANLYKLVKP